MHVNRMLLSTARSMAFHRKRARKPDSSLIIAIGAYGRELGNGRWGQAELRGLCQHRKLCLVSCARNRGCDSWSLNKPGHCNRRWRYVVVARDKIKCPYDSQSMGVSI